MRDEASFHAQCKRVFGFPDSYPGTMDAFVDCLSYLRDDDAMCKFRLGPDEVLEIVVTDAQAMLELGGDLLPEMTYCIGGINDRYQDYGEKPALSLVLR